MEEVQLRLDTGEAERLAELEAEKVALFERMGRLAEELKAAQRELFAVERGQRKELKAVEEHVVPEGEELTHRDFELWAESVFWSHARTAPGNPHQYVAKKRLEHPEMYVRIIRYVLDHGRPQRYYGTVYTVYAFRLFGQAYFAWPMTDRPEESEVFNAKPLSMAPDEEEQRRKGTAG